MATVYRCDRCGTEMKIKGDLGEVKMPDTSSQLSDLNDYHVTKELCRPCCLKLDEFIKPMPKMVSKNA